MHPVQRASFAFITISTLAALAATATAQPGDPADPYAPPADDSSAGTIRSPGTGGEGSPTTPPEDPKKKEPKAGDFDAGGQVRLPNGPDEMGQFATFNWVAVDLEARYFLLPSVFVSGNIPVAVIKPDTLMTGEDPSMIGGMSVGIEAKLPKMDSMPFASKMKDSEVGIVLDGAVMREGAMLLSEKDYPLFDGKFKPGFTTGLILEVKLSTLLDFSTRPVFVYQAGTEEAATAVQIPMSTILSIGSLIKVSADLGVFTGDDFTFRGSKGGRLALGGALDVKLGPIIVHAGAGAASLLTGEGGVYPTIGDSLYIDLNVKYAK